MKFTHSVQTIETNTLTLDDGSEVELEHQALDYTDPLVRFEDDGTLVVGYLLYDSEPDHSPIEEVAATTGATLTRYDNYHWGKDLLDDARTELIDAFCETEALKIEKKYGIPFYSVDLDDYGIVIPDFTDEQAFEQFCTGDSDSYRFAYCGNTQTTQPWMTLVTTPGDLEHVDGGLVEIPKSAFEKPQETIIISSNGDVTVVESTPTEGVEEPEWGFPMAFKYMDSVVDDQNRYYQGECYGISVERFRRDDDGNWESTGEMGECFTVWGFIGHTNAMENLKYEFGN